MKFKSKHFILISLIVVIVLSSFSLSSSQGAIPDRPANYVVDLAGIIDNNIEASLNRYLLDLEQKTTAQVVILTITSLEGESIEDLSLSIAHDKWRLGQKEKDNGLLLLVSLQDKKYRFEVGYGLEGPLPDSLVGSIGREYLVPYFRKGDYSSGIAAATLAVIQEIASDANIKITGMPKLRATPYRYGKMQRRKPSLFGSILTILFFIGLIYLFIRNPRLLLFFLFLNMLGSGRRSHWGGGNGGGFGGGFGGFGGGGGGGFGGGGASGGW